MKRTEMRVYLAMLARSLCACVRRIEETATKASESAFYRESEREGGREGGREGRREEERLTCSSGAISLRFGCVVKASLVRRLIK